MIKTQNNVVTASSSPNYGNGLEVDYQLSEEFRSKAQGWIDEFVPEWKRKGFRTRDALKDCQIVICDYLSCGVTASAQEIAEATKINLEWTLYAIRELSKRRVLKRDCNDFSLPPSQRRWYLAAEFN